jgi:hypothetical protein
MFHCFMFDAAPVENYGAHSLNICKPGTAQPFEPERLGYSLRGKLRVKLRVKGKAEVSSIVALQADAPLADVWRHQWWLVHPISAYATACTDHHTTGALDHEGR